MAKPFSKIGNKDPPPLPLEFDESTLKSRKTLKFKLMTVPTDPASAKIEKELAILDGSEPVRTIIYWMKDVKTVFRGLNLTTGEGQDNIVKQVVVGQALTTYEAAVETLVIIAHDNARDAGRATFVTANPGSTDAEIAAHVAGIAAPAKEEEWIHAGLCSIINFSAPHKALEKQKRYLRRYCRKPKDMSVRVFVNHLLRINYQEMCFLPPNFNVRQSLPEDEIVDILVNSIPRKWLREMDRLDFDPATHDVSAVVQFCERMESAEESEDREKKAPSKTGSSGHKKGKSESPAKKDRNCMFHGPNTHPTSECRTVQAMVASTKSGRSPNKTGDHKNKSWSRKANDNKQKAREEINAFVQKQVEKGLAKASLSKKKRPVKPYDDKELDAMLAEYDYDDLENLVTKDEDDKEDDTVDEDEISVDSEEASESS
jgi:hypothetical protein